MIQPDKLIGFAVIQWAIGLFLGAFWHASGWVRDGILWIKGTGGAGSPKPPR